MMENKTCMNCGLTLSKNPHPLAGQMAWLNYLGATYGCLPCAEKRANGRFQVITAFRQWLEEQAESLAKSGDTTAAQAMIAAEDKLRELDTRRGVDFHRQGLFTEAQHAVDSQSTD